jgi:hypothetical protein
MKIFKKQCVVSFVALVAGGMFALPAMAQLDPDPINQCPYCIRDSDPIKPGSVAVTPAPVKPTKISESLDFDGPYVADCYHGFTTFANGKLFCTRVCEYNPPYEMPLANNAGCEYCYDGYGCDIYLNGYMRY